MTSESVKFFKQQAVEKISAELYTLFVNTFGKEPDPQIIREEAESLVEKYGPVGEINDIFSV